LQVALNQCLSDLAIFSNSKIQHAVHCPPRLFSFVLHSSRSGSVSAKVLTMKTHRLALSAALGLALITGSVTIAQVAQKVNPHRHPNPAAALRRVDQAVGRIDAAQQAYEFDMGGHAAKAGAPGLQARPSLAHHFKSA
jgi:hypothetical protein